MKLFKSKYRINPEVPARVQRMPYLAADALICAAFTIIGGYLDEGIGNIVCGSIATIYLVITWAEILPRFKYYLSWFFIPSKKILKPNEYDNIAELPAFYEITDQMIQYALGMGCLYTQYVMNVGRRGVNPIEWLPSKEWVFDLDKMEQIVSRDYNQETAIGNHKALLKIQMDLQKQMYERFKSIKTDLCDTMIADIVALCFGKKKAFTAYFMWTIINCLSDRKGYGKDSRVNKAIRDFNLMDPENPEVYVDQEKIRFIMNEVNPDDRERLVTDEFAESILGSSAEANPRIIPYHDGEPFHRPNS